MKSIYTTEVEGKTYAIVAKDIDEAIDKLGEEMNLWILDYYYWKQHECDQVLVVENKQ